MRLCCCVALALICGLAPAEELKPVQSKEQPNQFKMQAGDVFLIVEVQSPIVYKQETEDPIFFRFLVVNAYGADGNPVEKTGNFIATTPPKLVNIQSASSSLKLMESPEVDHGFTFTEVGECKIRVDVGQDHFFIPIQVVPTDFSVGDSSNKLIESMGLPTSKTRHFVRWPELAEFDGIIYKPDAGEPIYREHWRYDKLPHAVFAIDSAKNIAAIGSFTQPKPIDLAALSLSLEPQVDDGRDPKLPPERDFREWENRLGQKTVLKFVKYKYPGVLFVTRGGDQIAYRLKDLSDADAALVQKLHAEEVKAAKEARQKKAAAAK